MYEIWLLQLVDLQAFPTSKYIFLNIAQIAGQANSESKERFVVTSNMQCLYYIHEFRNYVTLYIQKRKR